MDTNNLKAGKEIDALVAEKVMGWEKLNVEYFSTPECSERQIELEDWMDTVGLDSVGTYYIDVQHEFWIEVQDWRPSCGIRQAWQVVEYLMDNGVGLPEVCHDGQLWVTTIRFNLGGITVASGNSAPLSICRAALRAVSTSNKIGTKNLT